jgi:hypothetical protein
LNLPGALLVAVVLAAACMVPDRPATAQDRPVFPPTRDVAVTYRTNTSQPGTPQQLLVRYSVQADRLRVEAGPPSYLLIDRRTREGTVVMEQLGIMSPLPKRAGLDQAFILESGRHFTRRGAETVAGLRCTVWEVTTDAGEGTACVTADGVLLRANGRDRRGQTGSLEATNVAYAPQPEALFHPPANLRRVELPPGVLAGAAGAGAAGAGGAGMPAGLAGALDRLRGRP